MEYYEYLRQYVGNGPLLLPGSTVFIIDDQDRILFQEHFDGSWSLPGGLMDLGETFEEVARREAFEETGLRVKNLQLVNAFAGPDTHSILANGDEFYACSALYYTNDFEGELVPDGDESKSLAFLSIDEIPQSLNPKYLKYIEAAMEYHNHKN